MRNNHDPVRGLQWLLDQVQARSVLAPEVLESLLTEVNLSIDDPEVQQYVRFDPDHYARNFVLDAPGVQVLVLCWRPGQGSPIHHHGQSNCGVRILAGQATDSIYQGPLASASLLRVRDLNPGAVAANAGSFIHRIENRRAEDLVTLHIYSPPLVKAGR